MTRRGTGKRGRVAAAGARMQPHMRPACACGPAPRLLQALGGGGELRAQRCLLVLGRGAERVRVLCARYSVGNTASQACTHTRGQCMAGVPQVATLQCSYLTMTS